MHGHVAWRAWVALHIVTLTGQRNRLATMANLSVRYLAGTGRLNVIVGDPPPPRGSAPVGYGHRASPDGQHARGTGALGEQRGEGAESGQAGDA